MTLSEFQHRAWSMDEGSLRALHQRANGLSALMASGMKPGAELTPDKRAIAYNGGNPLVPDIVGPVATLEVFGEFIARAPWYAKAYMAVIDPFDLADQIDALATNAAITTIVLEIDSPGGSIAGTFEAAAAIIRAQVAGKIVEVRAAGKLCSAAYAIACAADRIIATPTTMIGSLGTVILLCDQTAASTMVGEKYEAITSAPLKGLGADGAITAARRAEAQRMVDGLNAVFRDAVAAGRGFDDAKIAAVFTGQCWLAAESLALGLIDAVDSPADDLDSPDGTTPDPVPVVLAPDADETDISTPVASATQRKAPAMAPDLTALAALAIAHPTHAALILSEAGKDGATTDRVSAAISVADLSAKAAELSDLRAQLAASETAKASAESEAKSKAGELAALKAHVTTHADPGGGTGSAPAGSKTHAEIDALTPLAQAAFFAAGGTVAVTAK